MRLEFDPSKAASNRAKHGVALTEAIALDWDTVLAGPDRRRDYGERRMVGYGLIGARLYCVVFVTRPGIIRVISFRKANSREGRRYVEAMQGDEATESH